MHLQSATAQPEAAPIIIWELTRACRLNCVHCTVAAQARRSPLELSTYEAYKTIDQIVTLRPAELVFTGGDVLERADIFQLVDYARRRGLRPTVTVSVTPALTGAVVGKLRRNGAERVALAIDGASPERHDSLRGGHGQFSSTLMALRWARTANLPIEVNTLLTRRNAGELRTIAELLADIGAVRWNVYVLVPAGQAKQIELTTADEVEAAFQTLYDISRRSSFAIRTFEAPQYRRFVMEKTAQAKAESMESFFTPDGELRPPADVRSNAVAPSEVIFISHTGEVSISPFAPLTAGNVRYQPLSTVYRTAELFTAVRQTSNLKGKCGRCEFRSICCGSRARAFAMSGDLFAADPLCAYQPGAFAPHAAKLVPAAEV